MNRFYLVSKMLKLFKFLKNIFMPKQKELKIDYMKETTNKRTKTKICLTFVAPSVVKKYWSKM